MLAIAFRRETGPSPWSNLIALVAGTPVHCALVVGDGSGWEAVAGAGVQRFQLTDAFECIPVAADPLRAMQFCARREGAKYDWWGALLHFSPLTSRDRWTCSELCAEALAEAGAPLSILDAGRTPRRLRAWATAHLTSETV